MNPTNKSKTKEFNKPSPNLKSKEIKRITKLLKKKVYPLIGKKSPQLCCDWELH